MCGIICRLPFGAPRLRFSLEVMHPNARGPASGGSAALLYAVFSFCLLTLGGPAQALRRGLPLRHPSHPPASLRRQAPPSSHPPRVYDTRGILFLPFVGRGPGVRLTHPSTWQQPVRYLLAPTLASTRIYCIRTTSLCMLCKVFLTLPGFSTRKVNILKCFPNAIRWFCTLRGPVIPSCGLAAHCMAFYHMHCFKI